MNSLLQETGFFVYSGRNDAQSGRHATGSSLGRSTQNAPSDCPPRAAVEICQRSGELMEPHQRLRAHGLEASVSHNDTPLETIIGQRPRACRPRGRFRGGRRAQSPPRLLEGRRSGLFSCRSAPTLKAAASSAVLPPSSA